jgi:hypothetical protein
MPVSVSTRLRMTRTGRIDNTLAARRIRIEGTLLAVIEIERRLMKLNTCQQNDGSTIHNDIERREQA